jgi:hypothetical protein
MLRLDTGFLVAAGSVSTRCINVGVGNQVTCIPWICH